MTTIATFLSPSRLIKMAMQDARKLGEGQEPTSDQYADNLVRLCDLINHFQTKGIKLWMQLDQSVTLVAGTATYTFGPSGSTVMTKPLRVIDAYYQDASAVRRPLIALSRDELNRLSQLTTQGAVTQYYVDKQQTQLSVTFWQTPDTTAALGTAHLVLQQQITNPTQINDTLNFPQEWMLALRWMLADELASGMPKEVQDRCKANALQYRDDLENWDVEDTSVRFQADTTMSGYYNRFP